MDTHINFNTDAGAAFMAARDAWRSAAGLRKRRTRHKDYTYGRQWGDIVKNEAGRYVTEEELAEAQGNKPMTNNMIRQLVKCIIGNFRSRLRNADTGAASMPELDADTASRNCIDELDCRMLEEFLISGCAVQRIVTERRPTGCGAWIDNISPDRFFVNRFSDPRGLDIELVGMLHDLSLRETIIRYSHDNAQAADRIARIYRHVDCRSDNMAGLGNPADNGFAVGERGRCRVIEVWTLESRSLVKCHDPLEGSVFLFPAGQEDMATEVNKHRAEAGAPLLTLKPHLTTRWHCRIFSPDGEVIDEYDSPYRHGSHPFVVKFYPLTDGEVHSFVEDVIDQQRYVNRLITLIDRILSISAKGVLLFPEERKPSSLTWEDISELWTRPGGVIPVHGRATGVESPMQLFPGNEPAGAYHLLEMQMSLFQRISGVNDALQGRLSNSAAASASLYQAQVNTATMSILDLMESFNDFRRQRNLKVLHS